MVFMNACMGILYLVTDHELSSLIIGFYGSENDLFSDECDYFDTSCNINDVSILL